MTAALALVEPVDAPDLRAELRTAIASRTDALRAMMAAKAAAARAAELAADAEARVADFASLDAAIAADAATKIAQWTDGEPGLEPNAKFAEQIRWRGQAQQKTEVARAAAANLNASLAKAKAVFHQADLVVGAAATALLVAEAETIAQRLVAARREVWALDNLLTALAGSWFPTSGGVVRPAPLPRWLLDVMADKAPPWRSPQAPSPEAAAWRRWREALTGGDADATLEEIAAR